MPRFAARQMARWLYVRGAASIDAMTDLSARNRALLSAEYDIGLRAPEGIFTKSSKKFRILFIFSGYAESILQGGHLPLISFFSPNTAAQTRGTGRAAVFVRAASRKGGKTPVFSRLSWKTLLQKCGRFYIMSPYRVSGTELRPGNMEE